MLGITKRFGFVLQEKLDLCRLKQNAEYPLVIYSLCPFIDDLLIIFDGDVHGQLLDCQIVDFP